MILNFNTPQLPEEDPRAQDPSAPAPGDKPSLLRALGYAFGGGSGGNGARAPRTLRLPAPRRSCCSGRR